MDPPKQPQTALLLKLKTLGDLCGMSATLCMAIMSLIDLQEENVEDDEIIDLTRDWETAARETNDILNNRLEELSGTDNLEPAIPEHGNWIGSWFLGQGSFGRASLFFELSDSGEIINRVVVKDCDFNETARSKDTWDNDPSFFSHDHTGAWVPTEAMTMFDLRGKQGSEYIVKILNWRIARKRRLCRLYLEVSSPSSTRLGRPLTTLQYVDPRKMLQETLSPPPQRGLTGDMCTMFVDFFERRNADFSTQVLPIGRRCQHLQRVLRGERQPSWRVD
jgi:hypothetical protein